ncbi:glycoside hydrolase family protein [Pedobacter sp. MW01-1-1]|uniref:glycoside hydrolase family protein n=1 Tax=Pedobacter sp. MW01-1-1 TaxID=3383027 RepID=UPI003FEFDE97
MRLEKIWIIGSMLAMLLGSCATKKHQKPQADLDLSALIQPVPLYSVLKHDDYWVWGSSMVRTNDGLCHLFYSRWPKSGPFSDWLLHSEIAYAVSKNPEGPYTFKKVVLSDKAGGAWIKGMAHNPHVHKFGDNYYLYFISTDLKNTDITKRINITASQRIGVAVADSPDGEWKVVEKPIVDLQAGKPANGYVTNPSICQRPDGSYLMIFKSRPANWKASDKFTAIQCLATAPTPTGPFTILDKTVLSDATAEDPFMWFQNNKYYAIADDQYGDYLPNGHGLVLFESNDANTWKVAAHALVSYPKIQWANHSTTELKHLERPQLYFDAQGNPSILFCAAMDADGKQSYNVHIPLQTQK